MKILWFKIAKHFYNIPPDHKTNLFFKNKISNKSNIQTLKHFIYLYLPALEFLKRSGRIDVKILNFTCDVIKCGYLYIVQNLLVQCHTFFGYWQRFKKPNIFHEKCEKELVYFSSFIFQRSVSFIFQEIWYILNFSIIFHITSLVIWVPKTSQIKKTVNRLSAVPSIFFQKNCSDIRNIRWSFKNYFPSVLKIISQPDFNILVWIFLHNRFICIYFSH